MRVEQLTRALHEASAAQAPVDGALDDVVGRHRRRRRRLIGGVAAVGVVVVGLVVGTVIGDDDEDSVIADQPAGTAVAGDWEQIPDPPLSPRVHTTMVWTGDEVLVIGGDEFACPPGPGVDCAYEGPTFADGAAFDPDTRTWRPIADAPRAVQSASTAVLDGDVYLWTSAHDPDTGPAFLRYSIAEDAWEELTPPPNGSDAYSLVATDNTVIAFHGTSGGTPVVFDVEAGTWAELPRDPLGSGSHRSLIWVDPYLYLFHRPPVPQPGPDPGLARVARLDPAAGIWEELPPAESLALGDVVVGTEIVSPRLGGTDGVEGSTWDRRYPHGGIYDIAVPEWRALPEAPNDSRSVGVIGEDSVWVGSENGGLIVDPVTNGGLMLDAMTDTWIEVPGLVEDGDVYENRNLIGTDPAIVAVGGERWDGFDGGVLEDAWMLTFGRG